MLIEPGVHLRDKAPKKNAINLINRLIAFVEVVPPGCETINSFLNYYLIFNALHNLTFQPPALKTGVFRAGLEHDTLFY